MLAQLHGLAGQSLLDLLPFCDIEQEPEHGGLAAIVDTPPVQLHLQGLAAVVQGAEAGMDVATLLLAAQHQLGHPFAVLRACQGVQWADAKQGAGGVIAKQVGKTGVDVAESALLDDVDASEGLLHQGAKQSLPLPQICLGTLEARDVAGDTEDADHLTVVILQRPLGGEEYPIAAGQGEILLLGLHPVVFYHPTAGLHQHLGLLGREDGHVILAQHLGGRFAHELAGGAVEQYVFALSVLGEDGILRAVGDGGEQLQRLQPLCLGVADLFGHQQSGVLAQQYDASVGDEEHQQADETNPDALLEAGLVELGLVYLGQQVPIRVRNRIDDAKGRDVAIIHAGQHPGPSLPGIQTQILGRQQGVVMERKVQAQGRVGAVT
ncbi:hypothetical protein D3C75_605860 [compost metagenome]